MSKPDTSKLVLDFLTKSNRPYALNDVVNHCGKDAGKSSVQKALEKLVEKGKITAKTFGKQNIYFIKQTVTRDQSKKELQTYKQKLAQSQSQIKQRQAELLELEKQLQEAKKVRSLDELREEKSNLLDEIRELNNKLIEQKKKCSKEKLTPADVKKIQKDYDKVTTAYKKRKRMCNDMIDAILEGYPKSKKILLDEIGMETDETVGFDLKV